MYRVPQQFSGRSESAVVKTSRYLKSQDIIDYIDKYNLVKQFGMNTVSFMEKCEVDGNPAVMMEDLSTVDFVYVSPNTVRHGDSDNEPEKYLLNNKIQSIANFDELLGDMRDLYNKAFSARIETNCDAIFFVFEKNNSNPKVSYKLVDLDVMSTKVALKELPRNQYEIKESLMIFVDRFVSDQRKVELYKYKIDNMKF